MPGEHAEHRRAGAPSGAPWSPGRRSVAFTDCAHRRDVEVELVAGPARLHLRAAREYAPASLWMLLAIRRRASSLPRLWGRSTVDGLSHCCDVGRRSALFKLRRASMIRVMRVARFWPSPLLAAPAAAQPAAAAATDRRLPSAAAAWDPVGALHHRRAGRARLSLLVSRRPVARGAGQGVQRLSRVGAGRRHPPDLAAAAHRDLVAGMRRPAVRSAAQPTNGRTWSRRCATSAIM